MMGLHRVFQMTRFRCSTIIFPDEPPISVQKGDNQHKRHIEIIDVKVECRLIYYYNNY